MEEFGGFLRRLKGCPLHFSVRRERFGLSRWQEIWNLSLQSLTSVDDASLSCSKSFNYLLAFGHGLEMRLRCCLIEKLCMLLLFTRSLMNP